MKHLQDFEREFCTVDFQKLPRSNIENRNELFSSHNLHSSVGTNEKQFESNTKLIKEEPD